MSWEWRFFVPMPLPEDGSIPVSRREDIYFPAGEDAGIKLRNGRGQLEVKLRTRQWSLLCPAEAIGSSCTESDSLRCQRCSNSDGSLRGFAEFWEKSWHRGCLSSQREEVQIDAQACARSLGRPVKELFAAGGGQPLPIRVLCRKKRKLTSFGEELDCIFIAMVDGRPEHPALVECFRSVCTEGGDLKRLAATVKKMGALPEGAIVAGYPAMVESFAQKALSACGVAPQSNITQSRQWRVLQAGDVRSGPSSDAPQIGRLSPGGVVHSMNEQISEDGRVWLLIRMPGENSDERGWTATTKKNGHPKLAADL